MSEVIMSNRIARRRNVRKSFLAVLALFVMIFVFTFLVQMNRNSEMEVEAASLDGFDPGYIISDWQMGNYNSMSEADIQAFLTSKNSCANRDYDYYLRLSRNSGYQWHWDNGHFVCLSEELFGDGEVIGSGETAAHILWQTAQDYKINPQALLVLLQKETGLITDPIPNNGDYRKATGYGCPDTAPCSSQYYGFKNQVRRAAALFRTVLDGGWTNYPLGENYVQYNPNPDCGGSVVNIRSLATSALYRYTPYQPNDGALAAGYGTAYCGAYGNRNFYLYFQDWFGGIKEESDIYQIPITDEDKLTFNNRANELKDNLGNSVGEMFCYIKYNIKHCVQRYENGYLISGPNGVWESYGVMRERWSIIGFEDGVLGYPISGIDSYVRSGNEYYVQRYENGYLISGPNGTWESYGEIRKRWAEIDYENGILGYPASGVYCYTNSKNGKDYCVQQYENGYLISGPNGTWESYGEIRKRWAENGYEDGIYGYPKGAVIDKENIIVQEYDNGIIEALKEKQ